MSHRLATGATGLAKNSRLRITDLLSYAADVAFEYEELGYGHHAAYRCQLAIVISTGGAPNAWPLIGVFRGLDKTFAPLLPKLEEI